jgi:hypothetical protein
MSEERLKVLDMLRAGQISADDAEQLLANLGDEPLTELDDHQVVILPKGDKRGITYDPDLPDPKNLWLIPVFTGLGILGFFGFVMTVFSAFLVYLCLSHFILLGMGLTAIGVMSRSSHWIHIRIQEKSGTRLKFSLPFPIMLTSWVVALLQPFIERRVDDVDLRSLDLAGMVRLMGDELSPKNPIMVAVDDDDDQVLIYIT